MTGRSMSPSCPWAGRSASSDEGRAGRETEPRAQRGPAPMAAVRAAVSAFCLRLVGRPVSPSTPGASVSVVPAHPCSAVTKAVGVRLRPSGTADSRLATQVGEPPGATRAGVPRSPASPGGSVELPAISVQAVLACVAHGPPDVAASPLGSGRIRRSCRRWRGERGASMSGTMAASTCWAGFARREGSAFRAAWPGLAPATTTFVSGPRRPPTLSSWSRAPRLSSRRDGGRYASPAPSASSTKRPSGLRRSPSSRSVSTSPRVGELHARVGDRPVALERWPGRLARGDDAVHRTAGRQNGDGFYSKRLPKGAPDWRRDLQDHLPERPPDR